MSEVQADVLAALQKMAIPHTALEHKPVHTMEDCAPNAEALGAVMPKNLFLTPRNQSAYYLMLVRPDIAFRTADISKKIGSSRLSFAPPEKLMELMRTLPGAISPMGLLFDAERQIRLIVDSALKNVETLAFHPCVNTMTLSMSSQDFFHTYLPALGYEPRFVEIDEA